MIHALEIAYAHHLARADGLYSPVHDSSATRQPSFEYQRPAAHAAGATEEDSE